MLRAIGIVLFTTSFMVASPSWAAEAEPLKFAWPVPCRVAVSSTIVRDSLAAFVHYVAHLYPSLKPGELKFQIEEPQVLDVTLAGRRPPELAPIMDRVVAMLSGSPPMAVSKDGRFLRAEPGDKTLALYEMIPGFPRTAEARNTVLGNLESDDRRTWDSWAGAWAGVTLQPGEYTELSLPLPLDNGAPIEGPARIDRVAPDPRNPAMVHLRLTATDDRELLRRALEANQRATGQSPPSMSYTAARRELRYGAILDPSTLRPNYTVTVSHVEMEPATGETEERIMVEESMFEWETPLAAAQVFPVPKEALDAYYKNDLASAYKGFMADVMAGSMNAETFSYLAELNRRSDHPGQADAAARRALRLSPNNSFAHCVLADTYNSQYSDWPRCNVDSVDTHLERAIQCDSTDGNAWLSLVNRSMQRGDLELERRCLTKLTQTGFLTPATMGYSRWVLRSLPKNAVLITNGDFDTYPPWALQVVEGLRTDVTVVNLNLLNLPWYTHLLRARGVPLPFSDDALEVLTPEWRDNEQKWLYVSDKIVKGWLNMQKEGKLERPLTFAATIPEGQFWWMTNGLKLIGPAYRCDPELRDTLVDLEAIRMNLEQVRTSELAGTPYSSRDRSPIRRSARPISGNVVEAWIAYSKALAGGRDRKGAAKALDRASDLAKATAAAPDLFTKIEAERASLKKP